jgi:hypothetical protein
LGTWSARGAEAVLQHNRALLEVADAIAVRVDEVLSLQSDATLLRGTHSGTHRASGGAYERQFLVLSIFGTDGLIARIEWFDVDRAAAALARFDELTAEPAAARFAAAPSRAVEKRERRVRPNAATTNAARIDTAIAARDADALPKLLADDYETVDHTTGATFDKRGSLATWRSLLRAQDPTCRQEPLATLGDSLALLRVLTSASGFVGGKFDVGAYEREEIALIEVDAHGRCRRRENFAADRMGAAVARLYERYADLLPDGPARARAAVTARSVAAMLGPFDSDRYAAALAADVDFVDHRSLGFGSWRGPEVIVRGLRQLSEMADDLVWVVDDILVLQPDALLVQRTNSGTDRASGGAFERQFINLWVFGADGVVTRNEMFDTERHAEALARFDALVTEPSPPRFANAAWRIVAEHDRAGERHDWDALVAHFAPGYVVDDRRSLLRTKVEGDGAFANLRIMFRRTIGTSRQLLATRGDRLALERCTFTSSARDGGPAEFEMLNVSEVDADGRRVATVSFDPEDLDAAYAELDDRYVAGEAAAFAASVRWVSAFRRVLASRDVEVEGAALLTADFVVHDHGPLGWGTLDRPAYVESLKG